MTEEIKIDGRLTVGPAPGPEELERLAHLRYRTVVDLRDASEQPFREQSEEALVRDFAMRYVNVPVPLENLKARQVDAFREQFARMPHPVYVHALDDERALAFAMIQIAMEKGLDGEGGLELARDWDITFEDRRLEAFIRDYLDEHHGEG